MNEKKDNRYGNLLDKYLDGGKTYTNLHLSREKQKYTKEEEDYMDRLYAEERHRQQQRELEEHRSRNDALVNKYLDMKKAKEDVIEQKKKEEKERQKFYETVEKLAKINPHTAEVYIKAQTKY